MARSGFLKGIEHRVRRALLRTLSFIVRRGRGAPPERTLLAGARILLIRQDRIGDVLVSTPFINALRRHLPGVTLDILVSTNNVAAVEGVSGIRQRWLYAKRPLDAVRMIRAIRRERYDMAVDLMDNPSATSTIFCLLSGARWTAGIQKENAYAYDIVVPALSRRDDHIVDRIGQLLIAFGIDPRRERFALTYELSDRSEAEAESALAAVGGTGRPIGINISAGSDVRYWGTDRFTDLVRSLRRTYRTRPVIILCKPGDERKAAEIAAGSDRVYAVPPPPSFQGFASIVRRLSLLVTPDTAAVHLAAAFRIPCVALYIQTDRSLRIWDPYRSPHVSLVSAENSLRPISAAEVAAAARTLLRGPKAAPRKKGRGRR